MADLRVAQAELFKDQLESGKLQVLYLDANDDQALAAVVAKADIVINALFYTFNEKVARTALACGVHAVDLGGHIGGATEMVLSLHEEAEAKGVMQAEYVFGKRSDKKLNRMLPEWPFDE